MARQMTWELNQGSLVVRFLDGSEKEFTFNEILDYVEPAGVTFDLFRHGLKQKLADSVAGMKDNTTAEKLEVMGKVWDTIVKGEWSIRKPAVPKVNVAEKMKLAKDALEAGTITQEQYDIFVMLMK
jgi:hypothetical protein